MSRGSPALVLVLLLILLGIGGWLLFSGTSSGPGASPTTGAGVGHGGGDQISEFADPAAASSPTRDAERIAVQRGAGDTSTGVRGRVLDARTLEPLAGVEVAAMREPPSLERLISRFRSAFFEGEGFFAQTSKPPQVLGRAVTAADGSFEILGVDPGVVFLDARSDFTFVRNPMQVRLARGEVRDGVELLGSPGGRIRGSVLDAEGRPAAGTVVSVRPGLNAFLGQMTQRKYRWLEAVVGEDGQFDIPGVPEGSGYTVSAAGSLLALEEVHRVEVHEAQVTRVDIQGHPGARVAGRVLDPEGRPKAGASVAMVYLDMSRILFSADGRSEPIETDADGRFSIDRVSPGRVAFIAACDDLAPSPIEERAVVDNGVYDDLELVLQGGVEFTGLVVDDAEQPIENARIEMRPMERPNDPDVLKLALKVRTVDARTGSDGRFVARGLTGERLLVQAEKTGYVGEMRFGVKLDAPDFKIVLTRGVTVRGRVLASGDDPAADGPAVQRFRAEARSRAIRTPNAGATSGDAQAQPPEQDAGRRRGPWGRGGGMREGSMRFSEGRSLGDRGFGGNWEDFQVADGHFELRGVPPGRIEVRVRADGYRNPESQTVELAPGATSDELVFRLEPGAIARGTVVDAATRQPVADAQVSAYRSRDGDDGGGGRGPFRVDFDPEDMDFLGLAAGSGGGRTARTDSRGRFEIVGLASGEYRFTARHPDRAKASATDVAITTERVVEDIVIELGLGGGIEGRVTGAGKLPLADAMIVALSISAGAFKSSNTDRDGVYRIDGLAPGQYIVFKSRMDERSTNLGYDLMGNMRLKTVTVRNDRVTRLDIHDETENSVRVFGTVRDNGQGVSRAMVTAIGADREGVFGMGLRAKPTDTQGNYELIGLEPGSYFFQVTRFQGRPEQANLSIDVPEGVREIRVDLDLPTSHIAGQVVDSRGNPVAGVQVSAGVEDGGIEDAPGLLGIIMKNGVAQARTDEQGQFKLDRVAAGTYRIAVSGRATRGRSRGDERYGEAALSGVQVDGRAPIDGLVITVPLAGKITGNVVDGSGNPVAGAELHYSREGAQRSADPEAQILDLFGVQARPARSNSEGRFELGGITPGTYRVRADVDGLSPGSVDDVVVTEAGVAEVTIRVVTGATLRVRAINVDGTKIPFAQISLLDGEGKPLASKVSVMSVFRRLMGNQEKKEDTGWYELGKVPPDTYTVVITEKDKPEVRFTREIRDGETIEWEVDLTAELKARDRDRK